MTTESEARASGYAWYVLAILFVVYILNFIDRQVISILAEDIKRDLNLKDEDLGYFDPRPWHQELPLRPKQHGPETLRNYWGFGSERQAGAYPGYV